MGPARFALLVLAVGLSGCGINTVRPFDQGQDARRDRAVVVYGVTVAGDWKYPRFTVNLDHYDLGKQAITGGCFRHDQLEARGPAAPAPTRFFAFEAPPGHYIYSGFNQTMNFGGLGLAFEARAGSTVYIGNFVLDKLDKITLHRDLDDATRQSVGESLPTLAAALRPAHEIPARRAGLFLCAP